MLLHVRVMHLQVSSDGAGGLMNHLFFAEVNDLSLTLHRLGLVDGLGHAGGAREGVGTGSGRHVGVLAFEGLGVNRNWSLDGVVALGDAIAEFLVS